MLNQVECYKCTVMLSLSRYVTVWTLSNIKCKWNVQAQRFTFIYSTFLCRVVMKIKFKRRKKKRHHSNEKAHALASKRQRFICSVGDASQFLIVNTSGLTMNSSISMHTLKWLAMYVWVLRFSCSLCSWDSLFIFCKMYYRTIATLCTLIRLKWIIW